MAGIDFMPPWVGEGGGEPGRNKNASSKKQDAMECYGLPLIGQKRPMNGAQFHLLWVGNAGGGLKKAMDGAPGYRQFDSPSPVPKGEGPGAPSTWS